MLAQDCWSLGHLTLLLSARVSVFKRGKVLKWPCSQEALSAQVLSPPPFHYKMCLIFT